MKFISAIFISLFLFASGATAADRSFGDSITQGVGASPATNGWAFLLWPALGSSGSTNYGVSNTMVADMATTTYPISVAAGDRSTIMIGTNDSRILLADPVKRGFYKLGLKEQIAWLALPTKQLPAAATLTGSWGATAAYGGFGKVSSTAGSKATFSGVQGDTIFVSMLYQSVSGTFDIKIDGATVYSGSTYAAGITTPGSKTYGPMLFQFPVAAGSHAVDVVVTGGSYVYLQWVAGNTQPSNPAVFVSNIIRASNYTYGGSDAIVADYNLNAVTPAVSELAAVGLNVTQVNSHDAINNTTDMGSDYHPVNAGHAKIKDAFVAAMSGPPPPPPTYVFEAANTFRRKTTGTLDGTFWIDGGSGCPGAACKQITTQ